MRRAAVAIGIVAILSSSCGRSELPTRLADTLQDRVATIRGFAEGGRPGLARNALRNLVELVTARLESGVIDEARAAEILEAARHVADQLALLPRSSPTISPSTSPVGEDDDSGQGEGEPDKDKGKGQGKGNGGDEGHGNDD
jgi:hypothetical protein